MSEKCLKLKQLTDSMMKEVRNYGILEVSLGQYQQTCNDIVVYASGAGETSYSPLLVDRFLCHLNDRVENGEICREYRRFQARVVRMLKSLAETGHVDFTNAKPLVRKYPVPDEVTVIIEDILQLYRCSDKTKSDLRAPIRHLFWYAHEHGYDIRHINDSIVMKFLIEEIPNTNSGSADRTLRCVKYVTEYLKAHGNTGLSHDYTMLKLKNAHIHIIPAFSEEEVSSISSAVDPSTPLGMRDLAVILLAYGTGLRGADIINMRLSDIDWRRQCVRSMQTKTHKPLTAELNGAILNAMADYILNGRPACDVPEVFVTVKAPYRRLSPCFANMLDKYCKKASIEKIPLRAFHSLRRSFETVLVSRGVPLETASQMMGHKSIEEDKPYITHNREKASFVAMDFTNVTITAGLYAGIGYHPQGGDIK